MSSEEGYIVKLQALVRGYIVRIEKANFRYASKDRMQMLVRLQAQARARASRSFHSSTALLFPSSSSSPRSLHKRCVSNADIIFMEDEDKIQEVGTWKPRHHPKPLRSDRNNESPSKRQESLLGLRSTENNPNYIISTTQLLQNIVWALEVLVTTDEELRID
ncbi:hypothetical protein HID58_032136 [Brassica napus]|uniref:Uncharacterized protein n=1 Tax=Brassica napus TaxID=3708 RepID=A0ABQ8BX37_BRANA|nr:hypothetical protein HID58_032136 [Brassica napus]